MTVIIDLAPIRDKTGRSRLLDMVEGRSKQARKTWLAQRPRAWRDAVEVVATDGFARFKTATTEGLPNAVAVMDHFHVVRLVGDVSIRTCTVTAATRTTISTAPEGPCTLAPTC